jgi:hypothetical protein
LWPFGGDQPTVVNSLCSLKMCSPGPLSGDAKLKRGTRLEFHHRVRHLQGQYGANSRDEAHAPEVQMCSHELRPAAPKRAISFICIWGNKKLVRHDPCHHNASYARSQNELVCRVTRGCVLFTISRWIRRTLVPSCPILCERCRLAAAIGHSGWQSSLLV